jgi:REP element-mobilizing transposase RayT
MTAPRMFLPGTTYLVTRRCSERRPFLRPSRLTNQIFLFVLAVAARRCGVAVHAVCVLSNHYHLLVTDPQARLPAFVQYLDGFVARAVNAALGHWEGFWASNTSFSVVSNAAPADIARKAAYALANPVAAGLVAHGRDWPGLWTGPEQLGRAKLLVRRPAGFFRERGPTPESAQLELTLPPGFASPEEFSAAVSEELRSLEDEAHSALASENRRFLGRDRVLAQDPLIAPAGREPRRTLNPRVAARDKWTRIEKLARLVEFVHAYHEALAEWRDGIRDVLFPAGTYRMRVEHGVRCAPA